MAVEQRGRRLTVRHEAIPSLMPEMTMPFSVRGPRAAATAGDTIAGSLVVTGTDSWLEDVRVVRRAPLVTATRPPAYRPRRPGERLADFRLTDQNGRAVRLRDLRGKTTVVTFIYTRCPLPDYCPLLSERLASLQRQVLADPRLRGKVALLAVSFDPDYDTPARLREYGARYGADPAVWRLLTGSPAEVEAVASQLSVLFAPDQGMINHNLETTVLDGSGRVVKGFSGNSWPLESLLAEIRRAVSAEGSKS